MHIRAILVGAALLTGCASAFSDDEEDIELSAVPAAAMMAAENAVPGFKAKSAEKETEDGRVVYEIEGKADGTEYEIEVTAEGEVLEIEED